MSEKTIEYMPGLAGVPAARSSVCYLDGSIGKLQYRGYPIEALAANATFEETAYLLYYGALPKAAELEAFDRALRSARTLKFPVVELMKSLPERTHPMDVLVSALAASGAFYPGNHVEDRAYRNACAIQLLGMAPSIVAGWQRIRNGDEPLAPRGDLAHAANFLYMLTGTEPEPLVSHVLDVALILHAEHQMNASTFAGRVVGSTLANPFLTVSAAVAALSGPLHGGANEEVLGMLESVPNEPEAVRRWAEDRLASKVKIMGFGHREYKVKDPRATILQGLVSKVFERFGSTPLYERAVMLEKQMADLVGHKGVYPNVDFYSGIVYQKMGIQTDLFTPVFAMARISGWVAHLLEQLEDNRIFRPNQVWVGKEDRSFVALRDRT